MRKIIFILLPLMLSCSSFNTTTIIDLHERTDSPKTPDLIIKTDGCGEYVSPNYPSVPELPYTEIEQHQNNKSMLIKIETKHIEDLRRYITQVRELTKNSIQAHNARCSKN